jgi:hypothetical protein
MTEFLIHGKHFAASQGRGHFAVSEVIDLEGMYAAADKPQTIEGLLQEMVFSSSPPRSP